MNFQSKRSRADRRSRRQDVAMPSASSRPQLPLNFTKPNILKSTASKKVDFLFLFCFVMFFLIEATTKSVSNQFPGVTFHTANRPAHFRIPCVSCDPAGQGATQCPAGGEHLPGKPCMGAVGGACLPGRDQKDPTQGVTGTQRTRAHAHTCRDRDGSTRPRQRRARPTGPFLLEWDKAGVRYV